MSLFHREGRRVKGLCPANVVSPFIMRTRVDSTNYYTDRVEVSRTEQYIRSKKAQGYTDFNMMYVILAAYVRTVAAYPHVNRFIRGQRIYARNCIEIMLTVKQEMSINAAETVVKLELQPNATALDVYRLMHEEIAKAKAGENADFDGLVSLLGHIPRLLMRGAVSVLNGMDYFGLLPRKLTRLSPFHGSLAITSMASLRIQPIYHHLYNFGNIPVFCAFGNRYSECTLQPNGEVQQRKFVDLKFTLDERITDGFGYAAVFHCLKHLMQNPDILDRPPEKVVQDIV